MKARQFARIRLLRQSHRGGGIVEIRLTYQGMEQSARVAFAEKRFAFAFPSDSQDELKYAEQRLKQMGVSIFTPLIEPEATLSEMQIEANRVLLPELELQFIFEGDDFEVQPWRYAPSVTEVTVKIEQPQILDLTRQLIGGR